MMLLLEYPANLYGSLDFPFKIYTSSNLLDFQLCLLVTFLIVTAHSGHDLKDRINELHPDDKVYNTVQVLYCIVL